MAALQNPSIRTGPCAITPDAAMYMACMDGLKQRADVGRTTNALLAAAAGNLCSRPSETLSSVITSVFRALMERTSQEDYFEIARLHGALCISLISTTPSHIYDSTICVATGDLLTSRQLVRHHILAVLRALWEHECADLADNGGSEASLRRVTLCACVDALWSHRTATSRVFFDYMCLLCVSSGRAVALEADCLCSLLLRRGHLLWKQEETRAFVTQLCDRVTSQSSLCCAVDTSGELLKNIETLSSRANAYWKYPKNAMPSGLTNDPNFRAAATRLAQMSREQVALRHHALGWPTGPRPATSSAAPAASEGDVYEDRPVLGASLARVDSRFDVRRSLRVVLFQISWEDLDGVVLELVRWGMQYENGQQGIGDLITLLYHDATSNPSWAKLYVRVFDDLGHKLQLGLHMTLAVVQGLPPVASGSAAHTPIMLKPPAPPPKEDITLTDVWLKHLLANASQSRDPRRFASIISSWVNIPRAGHHLRARILTRVVWRLVSKATFDGSARAAFYAKLCCELGVRLPDDIVLESSRAVEGSRPALRGRQLFAALLSKQCLMYFERFAAVANSQQATALPSSARQHAHSLASFVGELFKVDVLSRESLRTFIATLLSGKNDAPETALIALGRLLRLVGKALDKESDESLDACYAWIRDLYKRPGLGEAVRKALEDLVARREQGWETNEAETASSSSLAAGQTGPRESSVSLPMRASTVRGVMRGGFAARPSSSRSRDLSVSPFSTAR